MEQYLKRYVEIIYEESGKERRFEGCLYEHSEKFVFVGGKHDRRPIFKKDIKTITILRPEKQ